MKDYLRQLTEKISDNTLARCVVREYLQTRLLESLQQSGAFTNWAFVGGTALRFLYSMPRFSEDLDFSLTKAGDEDFFEKYMENSKKNFLAENYNVAIKVKTGKTVKAAFVKFEGLLYELGISPHGSEIISIKAEIDTNPPAGANFETSIVRKYSLLNLQHYDKSSLIAGKIHALLCRKYVKGRDAYDLVWYLSDKSWPGPNIVLLNNALRQTGWQGPGITNENWKKCLTEAVEKFDFHKVLTDVEPFIENRNELQLLTKENIVKLLHS